MGEKSFIRKDYGIECWSEKWNTFLPFAIILVFGFALMLPLVLASIVYLKRNDLYTPAVMQEIGFLYGRYNVGSEGWEIVELIRKLILTGLLVYLPAMSRTAAGVMVCVWACCLLNYYAPHKNRQIFWLCNLSYVLQTCKYLATTFEQQRNEGGDLEDERGYRTMGYLLISMDVAVFVGSMYCVMMVFVLMRKATKKTMKIMRDDLGTSSTTVVPLNKRNKRSKIVGTKTGDTSKPKKLRRGTTKNLIHLAVTHDQVHKVQASAVTSAVGFQKKIALREKNAKDRLQKRLVSRRKGPRKGPRKESTAATKDVMKKEVSKKSENKIVEKKTATESATDTMDTIPQLIELLRSKLKTRELFYGFFTRIDKDSSGACSKKEFGILIKNILNKKKTTTPINNIIQLAWKQASGNAMSGVEMEKNVLADFIFGKEVAIKTETKSQTNNTNDVNIRVPSRDEIDQLRKQIRAKIKNDRNKLAKIFAKLDKNKSDALCKQEFGNLLGAVMQKVPSKAVLTAIWSDATGGKKELDIKNWTETTDEKKELDIATLTEWIFI